MVHEHSAGVIVFRNVNGKTEYLLLFQHRSKTWSFPKGHLEEGEDHLTAALREVREETGLSVMLIDGFCREITYPIRGGADLKTVVLYLGKTDGEARHVSDEIDDFKWADEQQAAELLHHRRYRLILADAEKAVSAVAV